MPFTAGTFTPLYNWANEAASGNDIDPAKFTAEENDIATGLSTAILKDGTQTVTADIPWGGKKITNLGLATVGGDALSQAAGDARYGIIIAKAKTAATSRSSSTGLTNDPDLSGIALSAGHVYAIKLFVAAYQAGAGPGINMNLYYSGTFTAGQGYGVMNGTAVSAAAFPVQGVSGTGGVAVGTLTTSSSSPSIEVIDCTLVTTTGGNLSFQWGQSSSSSNATVVAPGSFLKVTQVG